MPPVETGYYDLLDVPTDADDTALKRAYRKQAIKYHPDKNPSADAEEKFKDISKAYQILSDPNLRAVYDKNGQKMVDKEGSVTMEDAAGFFANVFGGERFRDYIGEISIMKDMTNLASSMMTDEEKAEVEKEMNSGNPNLGNSSTSDAKQYAIDSSTPLSTPPPLPPSASQKTNGDLDREKQARIKAEQREKIRQHELARRKALEERVAELTQKMIERLRPFVEAENPGVEGDVETVAFIKKVKQEVEDLKLESFGVELMQAIGGVYIMKATSFMKSRKFLGIPGFFSRLKEKGAFAKDVLGVIGSALSVRDLMMEMEKAQAKGELDEDVLRALEMDVTGKVMLASWRGARLEVIQVLRDVVDHVLKEPGQSEQVLINRAKALLIIGSHFKSAVPDESDLERRELERMVHEAAQPRSKHAGKQINTKREQVPRHTQGGSNGSK